MNIGDSLLPTSTLLYRTVPRERDSDAYPYPHSYSNYAARMMNYFKKTVVYEEKNDGTDGSIVNYNMNFMLTVGWLIPRRGSVFNLMEIFYIIGFVMSTTILAYNSCEYRKTSSLCISLPLPSTGYLTLMTLWCGRTKPISLAQY